MDRKTALQKAISLAHEEIEAVAALSDVQFEELKEEYQDDEEAMIEMLAHDLLIGASVDCIS